jgi:hypothetical protein
MPFLDPPASYLSKFCAIKKEMLTAKEMKRSQTLEDKKCVVITGCCYLIFERMEFAFAPGGFGKAGDFYNNLIVG